jgi:hypothetical protein
MEGTFMQKKSVLVEWVKIRRECYVPGVHVVYLPHYRTAVLTTEKERIISSRIFQTSTKHIDSLTSRFVVT